jgi:hypothetical protein
MTKNKKSKDLGLFFLGAGVIFGFRKAGSYTIDVSSISRPCCFFAQSAQDQEYLISAFFSFFFFLVELERLLETTLLQLLQRCI